MPVGPVTPGSLITVTPDNLTTLPSSYNITPSPTMPVTSVNLQNLTLAMASADYLIGQRDYTFAGAKTMPGQNVINVADDSSFTINGTTGVTRTRVVGRIVFDSANWTEDQYGFVSETSTPSVGGPPKVIYIDVPGHEIPNGVTIAQVDVYVKGAGGSTPAVKPEGVIQRVNVTSGNVTNGAATTDTGSPYTSVHAISFSGTGIPAGGSWNAAQTRLRLTLNSEYGTGCVAGFTVYGMTVTYTQNKMDT